MSEHTLSRKRILAAFAALSDELGRRGIRANLFVVGGAAIAIAYDARRTTRDVDAIFEPKAVVYEAARAVAETMGLAEDWLNDAAKSFMPGNDRHSQIAFQSDWLHASTGSPEYLLAMKLLSSRVERDIDDIRLLYGLCSFTTPEEGLDLLQRFYPTYAIPVRTRFLLEELYGDLLESGVEDAGPPCPAPAG